MQTLKAPTILEVTLRDGSYLLDFKFSASDTTILCHELEEAGFTMIEVGHGVGLGASRMGKGQAAETDEAYMLAALKGVKKARWGMFCIPGIATLADVDLAAQHGMSFIRIGTNVSEMEESEPFIARAKAHGMYVCANFMKSYAMDAKGFAEKACLSQKYGADVVYIVDSAGGMLTREMESYFHAIQDRCDVAIGFHGHNNLELAVANSLRAVELGAAIVDTSLQGMGRSAGNTPTELFVAGLERMGVRTGYDLIQLMELGEHYIKPLLTRNGYNSIDIITGYAQFHSSYMGVIHEFAGKYQVDPRRLIQAVCEVDKIDAPRDLVERLAQGMSLSGKSDYRPGVFTARFRLDQYHGNEQSIPTAPAMATP